MSMRFSEHNHFKINTVSLGSVAAMSVNAYIHHIHASNVEEVSFYCVFVVEDVVDDNGVCYLSIGAENTSVHQNSAADHKTECLLCENTVHFFPNMRGQQVQVEQYTHTHPMPNSPCPLQGNR
eukprot:m.36778 g.36778  ORF g.36778 m.36778 type:complete len:123 (+) comp10113_c3_seq3:4187-4555(+)